MATILVVDDDLASQRLSRFILAPDHNVLTAGDGLQALDWLGRASVDLVITDLAMPVMDGLTMLTRLRNSGCYASLPVIVLSSSTLEHDRARVREVGASAFLCKPASPDDLSGLVQRLLLRATSEAGGAHP